MLDDHKDVENAKVRRDRHTEIAGDDGRCVIAQKGAPALITARFAAWLPSHILAHRARRDSNAELDQQGSGTVDIAKMDLC